MFKNALLVFLGASSFGVLSTFVKLAYSEGYNLGEVTGSQVLFGMVTLWILFFAGKATGIVKKRPLEGRDPVWKLLAAGLPTGLVTLTLYKCVELVPASIAIILLMQFVWIGILLDFLVFKRKPTRPQLYSVVLVLGGTLLAAGLFNQQQLDLSLTGVFYGILAATFYSIFLMVMSRVGNTYPPVQKSAFMLTGSCLLIFIVFPPTFLFNGVLIDGLWKWGLLLSLFGTVIPPLFFAVGIPKIGVTVSSIISAAELPVAVAMSYLILGEKVSGLQWIGVCIILSAIIISNLFRPKKTG